MKKSVTKKTKKKSSYLVTIAKTKSYPLQTHLIKNTKPTKLESIFRQHIDAQSKRRQPRPTRVTLRTLSSVTVSFFFKLSPASGMSRLSSNGLPVGDGTTSLSKVELNELIELYPNPAIELMVSKHLYRFVKLFYKTKLFLQKKGANNYLVSS